MDIISQSIDINAAKSAVWDVLADFGHPHRYVSGLVDSHLLSNAETGVGAIRHCELPKSMGMRQYIDEEITDWKEGEEYTYKVTDTTAPIRQAKATWKLTGNEKMARIEVKITYQVKGIMGHIMRGKMRKEFNNQIVVGLNDIRRHLEGHAKMAA